MSLFKNLNYSNLQQEWIGLRLGVSSVAGVLNNNHLYPFRDNLIVTLCAHHLFIVVPKYWIHGYVNCLLYPVSRQRTYWLLVKTFKKRCVKKQLRGSCCLEGISTLPHFLSAEFFLWFMLNKDFFFNHYWLWKDILEVWL